MTSKTTVNVCNKYKFERIYVLSLRNKNIQYVISTFEYILDYFMTTVVSYNRPNRHNIWLQVLSFNVTFIDVLFK